VDRFSVALTVNRFFRTAKAFFSQPALKEMLSILLEKRKSDRLLKIKHIKL